LGRHLLLVRYVIHENFLAVAIVCSVIAGRSDSEHSSLLAESLVYSPIVEAEALPG